MLLSWIKRQQQLDGTMPAAQQHVSKTPASPIHIYEADSGAATAAAVEACKNKAEPDSVSDTSCETRILMSKNKFLVLSCLSCIHSTTHTTNHVTNRQWVILKTVMSHHKMSPDAA